jgi:hypothetical protein
MATVRVRFSDTKALRDILTSCGMHDGRPIVVGGQDGICLCFVPRLDAEPLVCWADDAKPGRAGYPAIAWLIAEGDFATTIDIPQDELVKLSALLSEEGRSLELEFEIGNQYPSQVRIYGRA